jgi:hypothetical protein
MKSFQSHLRTLVGRCLAPAILFVVASQGQSPLAHTQAAMASEVKPTTEARSVYATAIENQWRQAGVDARVQLDGDQRDVLRIEWQGIGRRDIYAFVNSATIGKAQRIGFRSVVLLSGEQRWDYDLARQSMVWAPLNPSL